MKSLLPPTLLRCRLTILHITSVSLLAPFVSFHMVFFSVGALPRVAFDTVAWLAVAGHALGHGTTHLSASSVLAACVSFNVPASATVSAYMEAISTFLMPSFH